MGTLNLTEKRWTYEDYSGLQDGNRYEVIAGELLMTPAPDLEHQDISRDLEFLMWQYVKEKNLGKVFDSPVDVVLDEENVVQPDIVFVSNKNAGILQKKGIIGVPDLVVEIQSPSSLYRDRHQKKALYERFGVRELWIVDPANKAIEVFLLEGGVYKLFSFASEEEKVRSKVIDGFEIEISEIMGGEKY